jgi:small ligand-binding sensory domain FIST
MSVRIGCGLSTDADVRTGATQAAAHARDALEGAEPDLAVVFATGAHLAAPEASLEGVHEELAPHVLVGCGAGGVLATGREVEEGTALAVWAASLDEDAEVTAFHASVESNGEESHIVGLPDLAGTAGAILFPDPYTFPTDVVLAALHQRAPEVPVLGGLSSARTLDGTPALFFGDEVIESGAVGLAFEGVEMIPCVSQGARPLGDDLIITAADGHVIHRLDDRPALDALRDAIEALTEDERELIVQGMLVGLRVDAAGAPDDRPEYLVRGLLGADPEAGWVAVGAPVSVGQGLRLQARDADSADRNLREELSVRRMALGGATPAGALVFTCNGRGRDMFGVPDHDADALIREFGRAPAAGFFAAGEIGPVGGESFLHGFTATMALFPG